MYGASDSAVSNPDLKPQKGTNYELGWKRVSDNHSWKAAIYHIDITDNITATSIVVKRNINILMKILKIQVWK